MTPTRPNTLSISVKVYKKNIITNKYQHDAYYCAYDTNSSQPMREWFKLGFVYSIHINTNMVKIVLVGLEQASQYVNNCNYILCYGSGNYSALPTKRSHPLDPNRWWKSITS